MGRYVIRRLLIMIPTILAVVFVIFTILYFTPGDPAEMILGATASEADLDVLREKLGLNDSYLKQLGDYLYNLFIKFDFGTSWIYGTQISTEILARFPRTVLFAVLCMVLSLVVGVPLGVSAAVHQDGLIDRVITTLSVLLISVPGFWLAMIMVILFSVELGWLPPYGIGGIQYYIMPVVANSLATIASIARQTRSCMLEVTRSDYVTMARAKGLSERRILYIHALPNGMIPLLTMVGTNFASSMGGTMIIENIFAIPGMGMYLTDAITNRDYPVVRATVVFLAIVFCLIMLVVDLSYCFANPRLRTQYAEYAKKTNKKKTNKK